jgi:hypothetical protein
MAFADILQALNEEADRTQLDALAGKYPVLRRYAESGEVLETLKPRLKALLPEYEGRPEDAIAELESWRGWKAKHYNPATKRVREEEALETALTEARTQIAELEARTDTDMTPDEIKQIVKAALAEEGVVSNAALEARLTKALSPAAKEGEQDGEIFGLVKNVNNSTALRFQDVYSALEEKADTHREMFGERLDRNQVFKFMQDNKVWDANEAYNRMNATRIQEKQAAQIAADKEAARQEGIKEGERKALAQSGGRAIPVDGKGGGMGFAEARRQSRMKPKEGETFRPKLGQGIAQQHMQERREAAMAGTE